MGFPPPTAAQKIEIAVGINVGQRHGRSVALIVCPRGGGGEEPAGQSVIAAEIPAAVQPVSLTGGHQRRPARSAARGVELSVVGREQLIPAVAVHIAIGAHD